MFQSVLLSPQEIYSNIQINECFFYSLHKQKKKNNLHFAYNRNFGLSLCFKD